jgi:type VI secretion system secreted protein VgrG
VGGGLGEWLGSLNVVSKGFVSKKVVGLMRSSIDGALAVQAGGDYALLAKSTLTLKVGGSLTLGGAPITFKCGASEIVSTPGGLKIKSPSITITGSSRQSGSLTHR